VLMSHPPGRRGTLRRGTLRHTTATLAAAGAILLLATGCSTGSADTPVDGATDDWVPGVPNGTAVCDQIAGIPIPAGDHPRVVLVIDNTASGRGQRLAPAVSRELQKHQSEQAVLEIVGVDGKGAPARRRQAIALDPTAGDSSPEGNESRATTLKCVDWWAAHKDLHPTAAGSDILTAVNEAGRQKPAEIIVASDGIATQGELTLDGVGLDNPTPAVQELANRGSIVNLQNTQVVWTQLCETNTTLSEAVRTGVKAVWERVFDAAGVKPTFETATSGDRPEQQIEVPEDPWEAPKPQAISQGDRAEIPNLLLFAPDSAALAQGAQDVLRPVAQRLAEQPRLHAKIEAHCADFGDPAGQYRITVQRADAVIKALEALGVPKNRLTPDPKGSQQPAANEWPKGRAGPHDLQAASKNRRVVIIMG
jgi:outer membrane protein OmpA-like peptidoglycan-associated protein